MARSLEKGLSLLEKIFWLRSVLVLLVAFGLTAGITVPKLYKAGQIKGWFPGATTTEETLTQKWHQTPHPNDSNVYWVAWSEASIQTEGDHRLRVTPERWDELDVGTEIEVIWVGGDRTPYLRDGRFVSVGNLAFDGVLLLLMSFLSVAIVASMVNTHLSKGTKD
ncbi:MAG: hypothetical protein ACFB0C_12880 [Leptolyngbyaceae cyanobacterium]